MTNSEKAAEQTGVDIDALDEATLLALDYDAKLKLLDAVNARILSRKTEFARLSGRYAELKAEIDVLKHLQRGLQSSIKAEGLMT